MLCSFTANNIIKFPRFLLCFPNDPQLFLITMLLKRILNYLYARVRGFTMSQERVLGPPPFIWFSCGKQFLLIVTWLYEKLRFTGKGCTSRLSPCTYRLKTELGGYRTSLQMLLISRTRQKALVRGFNLQPVFFTIIIVQREKSYLPYTKTPSPIYSIRRPRHDASPSLDGVFPDRERSKIQIYRNPFIFVSDNAN